MKNIGTGHEDDPYYRYQREVVKLKQVRFNGITTQIVNFKTICAQIKVEPDFLRKHLQKKLGVPKILYETKQGVASLQGKISADAIEKTLDKFIQQFLICKECKLPKNDTLLKGSLLSSPCTACGASSERKTRKDASDDIALAINDDLQGGHADTLDTVISLAMKKLYDIPGLESQALIQECWDCKSFDTWTPIKEKIDKLIKYR